MKEAASKILSKGYKDIVYMDIKNCTCDEDMNFFSLDERLQGYKEGMAQAGLCCHILNTYNEKGRHIGVGNVHLQ